MKPIPDTRASLIIRLPNSQDVEAWREFVRIYEPALYRLALRKGMQDADARESIQRVLIAVARAVDRWNPDQTDGSFRGWLYRIARNEINRQFHILQRVEGSGDTGVQMLLEGQYQQPADSGIELEYRREIFRLAAERIRHEFQDSTWESFRRTAVEGEAVSDVAEHLGLTTGAVYIARSRVMARLRDVVRQIEDNYEL